MRCASPNSAGIRTAAHRTEKVAGKTILLSRRFDRAQGGRRTPFLSAMAMLGFNDGVRGSYPELVEALRTNGSDTDSDVGELFRRMIFNILASNVDDHLRNHGFLWSGPLGWKLSPAYDLNPVPANVKAHILSTNISLDEGTCSIDLARESAEYFGLPLPKADSIIQEVATAVSRWRSVAKAAGAKASEVDRMESAFEHGELRPVPPMRSKPKSRVGQASLGANPAENAAKQSDETPKAEDDPPEPPRVPK